MKSNFLKKNRLLLCIVLVAFLPLLGFGQSKTVTGNVIDETGNGMPGVSIRVKGVTAATVTDIEGNFSINVNNSDVLLFSFIGMSPQEVVVGLKNKFKVSMTSEVKKLEEFVVVGYGIQKKKSVVGAISQVKGSELIKMKMGGSVENSLQGNIPGLTVYMTDPTPGEEAIGGYYAAAPIKMIIRGSTSINGNAPLVLVDGVERSFSNLDPNEIASVAVLKDASATAVYGVRGANGVIIVTTKRGNTGALELNLNTQFSMKVPTRLPEYLNSYETMKMRNEAYSNDQKWDKLISNNALEHYRTQDSPYLYPNTDWMDYVFKPGFDQEYNLNARGGNNFVKYFVSVGYLNEGDVFNLANVFPYDYDKNNAGYFHNRYNFRNNLDFNLTKTTKLSVNLGGNIKQWGKPIDVFTQELWFEPVTVPPFYPVSVLSQFPDTEIPYNQTTPRPGIVPGQGNVRLDWNGGRGFQRKKSNELNADVTLEQALDVVTPGLSVGGTVSYNNYVRYEQSFTLDNYYGFYLNPVDSTWTRYDVDGAKVDTDTPQPLLKTQQDDLAAAAKSYYLEGRVNYIRSFGKSNVSGTGLFSRRESRSNPTEFLHYEENWVARGTYNYMEKYFFEGSISYAGSEKFSPDRRFGTFPSMAAGWVLSNEEFFKNALPWANMMKIRYSLGQVGSDQGVARWLYSSQYSNSNSGTTFGYPYEYYPTISEGNVPVTDITWETATKQDIGLEMGFLSNQITLNVDVYNEMRTGMLQNRRSVPTWVGVSGIAANIGESKSHGFEIELGLNKTFTNQLNIYFNGILAGHESRVVKYDEPVKKASNLSLEGKPVEIAQNMTYNTPSAGIQVEGYYQSLDELFMAPLTSGVAPGIGDQLYLDYNGDGIVDQSDNVVSKHPYAPLLNWSAKFGINYKNWSGRVDFYGISPVEYQMRNGGMFYLYPFSQNKDNALTGQADYWTPANTTAAYPAVHSQVENNPNYHMSSFSSVNGEYFRLKNLRIGYTLDMKPLRGIGIKKSEIALTGTNLITWTKMPLGGDPEGGNSGVDFGAYPQMKRYSIELNFTF